MSAQFNAPQVESAVESSVTHIVAVVGLVNTTGGAHDMQANVRLAVDARVLNRTALSVCPIEPMYQPTTAATPPTITVPASTTNESAAVFLSDMAQATVPSPLGPIGNETCSLASGVESTGGDTAVTLAPIVGIPVSSYAETLTAEGSCEDVTESEALFHGILVVYQPQFIHST